ncbi:hypothetical protein [Blastococcus montanus]|uniref:hypothetical protein n=1 Tax=Blastococcus montanus TaxID=3144973 RepID=UPI00320A01F5
MLVIVRPRRLTLVLIGVAVLLGAVSLTVNLLAFRAGTTQTPVAGSLGAGPQDFFNVDREANLPTWFATAVLLLAAASVAGVAAWASRTRDRWRWHWWVLAATFCYLSIDELVRLHEKAIGPVSQVIDATGIFTFGWWVPAAPLVIVFAIAYLRFLRALPAKVGGLMVLAGALYVGGAMGMEIVGSWVADARGTLSPAYSVVTTVEEMLEMLGVIVFLHAVATYANSRLTVVDASRATAPTVQAADPGPRRSHRAAQPARPVTGMVGPRPAAEAGLGDRRGR